MFIYSAQICLVKDLSKNGLNHLQISSGNPELGQMLVFWQHLLGNNWPVSITE